MSWVKIDDGFAEHRKIAGLSDAAFRMHVAGLCYAARNATDGFVPLGVAKAIGGSERRAAELMSAGVWHLAGGEMLGCASCAARAAEAGSGTSSSSCTTAGGWVIHDFLQFNPSRAEQEHAQEIVRRRWAMNHNDELRDAVRSRDGDRCRYCAVEVNWRDRRGPNGGTYDVILPLSTGGREEPANIAVCCRGCNARKRGRTPDEAAMILLPPHTHPAQTRLIPDLHPIRTGTAPN